MGAHDDDPLTVGIGYSGTQMGAPKMISFVTYFLQYTFTLTSHSLLLATHIHTHSRGTFGNGCYPHPGFLSIPNSNLRWPREGLHLSALWVVIDMNAESLREVFDSPTIS